MVCNKCGANFEDETLTVCPTCGEALVTVEAETVEEATQAIEEPSAEDVEATINDTPTEEELKEEAPLPEEEEVDEEELRRFKLDEIQARRDAKIKKAQHKKIAGAIALVIVIVAIAAGGLWFLAENSDIFKDSNNIVKNNPTTTQGVTKEDEILTAGDDLAGATIHALELVVSKDDKYYFKFSYDNKYYLARVNYGTTEDQIKDNLYVVDAHADEEYKVDGKVAYVLDTIFNGHKPDEDVLAKSATELLTDADLEDLDSTTLYFARNEIYARHGKKFNEKRLDDFFAAKDWFTPVVNFNDSILTATELNNAEFILKRENEIN